MHKYVPKLFTFVLRTFFPLRHTHTHTHAHVVHVLTRSSTRLCRKMHELYILYTPPTPPFLTPKNGAKTEKFLWADDHGTFSKSILPPPWDPPRGPKRGVLGGVGVFAPPLGEFRARNSPRQKKEFFGVCFFCFCVDASTLRGTANAKKNRKKGNAQNSKMQKLRTLVCQGRNSVDRLGIGYGSLP